MANDVREQVAAAIRRFYAEGQWFDADALAAPDELADVAMDAFHEAVCVPECKCYCGKDDS